MDVVALVRMLGGLLAVLGLLAGALWIVRHFDLKLPGRISGGATKRNLIIHRQNLDQRRSLAVVAFGGKEHLLLLTPEGNLVVDTDTDRRETA